MVVRDQEVWDAKILVVGEAPGREEMEAGRPFVGQSGFKLKEWMRNAGINKDQCYITNVLDTIPSVPGGNITEACKRDRGLVERIQREEYPRLARLCTSLHDLRVVVCVGNYAARAFTRVGSTQWEPKNPGITSVRGSVYQHEETSAFIIPTIHPAAVMRQPAWENRCRADWKRIAYLANGGRPERPDRHHTIYPTITDVERWITSLQIDDVISFDIETWGGSIKCIGFAKSPHESIVIPTQLTEWEKIEGKRSRAQDSLRMAWIYIRYILESDWDKVGQGALFDTWWLAQPEYGIKVRNYWWDTLAMHHAIQPNESHSLEFLASIYTWERYWKDEAKDAESIMKIARSGMERLYVYNGLDVTVTWEIFSHFYDILEESDRLDFYFRHYADMNQPILNMMLRGAPVDRKGMEEGRRGHLDKALRLRDEASLLVDTPMFRFNSTALEKAMIADYYENGPGMPCGEGVEEWLGRFRQATKTLKSGKVKRMWTDESIDRKWAELQDKGISDDVLNMVLYGKWHCPTGKFTDTGKEKADNVALKTLQNTVRGRKRGDFMDHKDDIIRLIDLTLGHRRERKLATFYDPSRLDDDDRIRCTYKFTTKTGRLASATNPRGTGTNLQNQDRKIRHIYVASPGRVLLSIDLSQAEGRVVKVLAGDPATIESARRLPTDGDEHTENAIDTFSSFYGRGLSAEDITHDLRQIGKKVVHASNYDQGKFGLSDTLLKEGFTMTPTECGKLITAHRGRNPYIDAYQSNVRRVVLRERKLVTSWGREISFEGYRLDEGLYKFAYSYIPQSEIGDLLNQYGVKPLDKYIIDKGYKSDIILQVHDEVVIDCVPDEAYDITQFTVASLSQNRQYGQAFGREVDLAIPCTIEVGLNWEKGKEWKTMPTQNEMNTTIAELITQRLL